MGLVIQNAEQESLIYMSLISAVGMFRKQQDYCVLSWNFPNNDPVF